MLLALLLALAAHPDSVSSTHIEVSGARARLQLRSEERTFLEALPVDRDGDGRLDAAELRAGAWTLADYAASRYHLAPLVAGQPREWLEGRFVDARAIEPGAGILAGRRSIELAFEFELPPGCDGLRVRSELFVEANPLHRDQCEIVWNGALPATKLLWSEAPEWTFRALSSERPNVVLDFVGLGLQHILTGYDHLAFLLALVVASRGLRGLVGVVTSFTLAHSLSLAAASLGWVVPPARAVEVGIALTIVFVALRNVLDDRPRRLWPEAFAFGLVHGLGFAGALSQTLSAQTQKLKALFGFNAGVEIGQLAVVLAVVGVLALVRPPGPGLEPVRVAPRWVRVPVSCAVALAGCYWVVSRAL
ncbi:MAG: HupE/UreJ family protein [Planctomycetes bacterium]|nr:HupE/UreJ family protein [Planctomycetota bacterium]